MASQMLLFLLLSESSVHVMTQVTEVSLFSVFLLRFFLL